MTQEVASKSAHADKPLKEINEMVQQGLARAKEVAQETNREEELKTVIGLLAQTWETVCFQFVVLSAGLYGMTKRSADQILQQLEAYRLEIEKHQNPITFKDFKNAIGLKEF